MADDTIRLRAATASDTRAIASLLAALGHPAEPADIPGRLAAIAEEGGAVVVAVDARGEALGMISMARHTVPHSPGPIAYITALVTAGSARRRGVGQRLVAHARDWAMEKGCARLTVTSAEHRADAHAFYPACGMPYTGRRFSVSLDLPGGEH